LHRKFRVKHVIEGKKKLKKEVTGRQGRRRTRLLEALKETRGCCKLKEEALDHTLWRTGFGSVSDVTVRQTSK
jgi:transcription elongation GreA/GreB family factor